MKYSTGAPNTELRRVAPFTGCVIEIGPVADKYACMGVAPFTGCVD